MGYSVQNGKAINCTFTYVRHTREALESTYTPKRQEKDNLKKINSHGRLKIFRDQSKKGGTKQQNSK